MQNREAEPRTDWSAAQEADAFARAVRLYRKGEYDADSFRRFRLQHGAYGTRMTSDYAMIRVKLPAGEVYPAQLEKLADLSEQFSIGSAHVSTRENVQLHWVVLEDVSEVFRGLAEAGLTSREACGNSVRNVMCSPLSGVCPREEFDSTPYALAVARFFLRNPMAQNLPRKFKFNFTCCEDHGMARMVDVGLVPASGPGGERGFRVFLGGGLGNRSFVGRQLEDFTPAEDLLHTSISVVRVFDRLGDRKNLARNRLRYLVNDMGWDAFSNLVLKERAVVRATQSVVTRLNPDTSERGLRRPVRITSGGGAAPPGYARWLSTSTQPQRQAGHRTAFISLESGDITAAQLRSLASIVRDYSAEGAARAGFVQDFALRHVHEDDLPGLYSELLGAGLARPGALTMAAPVGCSGTTSCNLALTNSHRLSKEVQRKFLELGLDEDPDLRGSSVKISGCPNSCAQHGIATVGFFGGGGRVGKDMYPNYMMSLGGRSDGRTMLGVGVMRVPAKRVIPALLRIIEIYRSRKKGGDTLESWAHRVASGADQYSLDDLKRDLAGIAAPPDISEDPDFYSDYGADGAYHTKTGKGECAA